jgi:hypothetical protein
VCELEWADAAERSEVLLEAGDGKRAKREGQGAGASGAIEVGASEAREGSGGSQTLVVGAGT